jgi:glutaminyl-peptide cyclotransferase
MRIGIMVKNKGFRRYLTIISIFLGILILTGCRGKSSEVVEFDSSRAYQDVIYQVSLGPRVSGGEAHSQIIEWMVSGLTSSGWIVEQQKLTFKGKEITNIIAKRDDGTGYILLGAHYDSRIFADRDPEQSRRTEAVPGANDGASGVAVLMELARILPLDLEIPIRLVFFDAEDNGGIEGWEWILGSQAFVEHYEDLPSMAIIIDMIGDEDLNIYYESNSDSYIMERIWNRAKELGYGSVFINEYRHSVLDDHTPFVQIGIPAVDIIDLDYPYWHTTADTVDKVSEDSLDAVGKTLFNWIKSIQ